MKHENGLQNGANIAQIVSLLLTVGMIIMPFIRNVKQMIVSHPLRAILLINVIYAIVIIVLVIIMRVTRRKNRNTGFNYLQQEGITKYEPYILIIEDKKDELDRLRNEMSPIFNRIAFSYTISHELMARSFDIIIADYANAGCMGGNSESILNKIKYRYPYKFVCAMSSLPSYQNKATAMDKFYFKDKKGEYIKEIITDINSYQEQIQDISKHWSIIEEQMRRGNRSSEDIEKMRLEYLHILAH